MPNLLPVFIISAIWFGAIFTALLPSGFLNNSTPLVHTLSFAIAPFIFVVVFGTLAGLISRTAQKGVKPGKFPRELMHPVYFLRRIYGLCWNQIYYSGPIYTVILAVPFLKKYVFRLFGYRGSTNFIVHPDTWIRDLPLLDIGEGAYLANRASVGPNICLSDGTIYVAPISIGKQAIIGHLVMIAPGAFIGERAEIGVGSAVGIGARVHIGARIGPTCTVNHGAIIGARAEIGTASFIGLKADIGEGLVLPGGSNIPAGAILRTREDVEKYYTSETKLLSAHRESLFPHILKNVHEEK